jgi:fatty acid desaturase
MMIFHQCSHRNMYRRPRLDTVIGEALAALLVVQNFRRYQQEHVAEHHAVHHMTLRDPTVQAFLLTLDLHPGMSRRVMWRRVLGRLVSPLFHARFAVARARSFWHGASARERVIATVVHGGALTAAVLTGHSVALLVVCYVPLVGLFQVSNTLRLCVKHTFPAPDIEVKRGKAYFGSLTSAVFIGEAVPCSGGPLWTRTGRWLRWTARMLFVHAPVRYAIITADTPVHDYHHRYPAAANWAHHLYARQADLDAGTPGWPPYTELWGLVPAMNRIFDSLAQADPAEFDVRRIRDVSRRDLFAAFDD